MTRISTMAADEAENLLWWDIEPDPAGIRCCIWVIWQAESAPAEPGALERPDRAPDFSEVLPTVEAAVEYLAGDDVCLRDRARQVAVVLAAPGGAP